MVAFPLSSIRTENHIKFLSLTFRFHIRHTRCGVTVTLTRPRGSVETKRFRGSTQTTPQTMARRWIADQVAGIVTFHFEKDVPAEWEHAIEVVRD